MILLVNVSRVVYYINDLVLLVTDQRSSDTKKHDVAKGVGSYWSHSETAFEGCLGRLSTRLRLGRLGTRCCLSWRGTRLWLSRLSPRLWLGRLSSGLRLGRLRRLSVRLRLR